MSARGAAGANLAIDAGQTAIKVRLDFDDGRTLDRVYPGVRTHEPLLPQLAEVAREVAEDGNAPVGVVSAGVSGLTAAEADARQLRELVATLAPARVLLAHDSITSYLGSLGDQRGAVVAAGTGVVTLAVGRHRVARVDGWGNIMGDAGSAYWIGREALDAAMRAHDGRGEPTALLDLLRAHWPVAENAYVELQSDPDRVAIVAALARSVSELAESDVVAERICVAAARELAHSVSTALWRVADADHSSAVGVSLIGGVFRSELIRTRFSDALHSSWPGARVQSPHGDGLDGAASLPRLAHDHPLSGYISVATAVT